MIDTLLPFLMFGILVAALLARPLARQGWISLPVALMVIGFVSSEVWVGLGRDTGLRWEILRDLVFYLLLPVLIFEASITVNVRALRREAVLIGALAVPLLLLAAALCAAIALLLMGEMLGNNWVLALLIGTMISATDPTAVSGVLKGSAAGARVSQILEGESLINDATTITLFAAVSAVLLMPESEISGVMLATDFLVNLLGGAALGMLLGWLFDKIIGPADEKVLATSATLVLAFSSFWMGEHLLGISGVVATLAAGLTIAWRQRLHRREEDIAFAIDSWKMLGFMANAMLFFLVGMSFTLGMFADHWLAMLIGILAAIVSRAVIVFLGLGPLSWLPGLQRLDGFSLRLINWGGIRGAVAIALALSLDLNIPGWYVVQSTVYGVALFSLVVQTPVLGAVERERSKKPDV